MGNKKKIILCLLFCLLITTTLYGKTISVTGHIRSSSTLVPIENVNISYTINNRQAIVTSDKNGMFKIKAGESDCFSVSFSHIGYQADSQMVCVENIKNEWLVILKESTTELNEVVVKKNIPLVVQRNDTTIMYAEAYKVNRDATVEDLLLKMPGITKRQGVVEVHGEEVKRVLVDGKDYFKNDIAMALQNLPANTVNEIQVFDQLSDFAKITGFDDGNRIKTINIVTKRNISDSQFGKLYAGIGTERYKLYGMYNFFKNDRRVSLFGQSNDISEQNFSIIDLLSSTGTVSENTAQQSPFTSRSGNSSENFQPSLSEEVSSMKIDNNTCGETKSTAGGVNFNDLWKGDIKSSGHYMFNSSENDSYYSIDNRYLSNDSLNLFQNQDVNTGNVNHRFNYKLEYPIDKYNYLLIKPAFSYQAKETQNAMTSDYRTNGYLTAQISDDNYANQNSYNIRNELLYVHKFKRNGSVLTSNFNFDNSYTKEAAEQQTDSNQSVFNNVTATDSYQKSLVGILSFIEPVSRYNSIKLDVGINNTERHTQRDVKTGENMMYGNLLINGTTGSELKTLFSNIALMHNKRKLLFTVGVESRFLKENSLSGSLKLDSSYTYVLPFAFLRYRFLQNNQLHIQYKSEMIVPTILQKQEIYNISNSTKLIKGAIGLPPVVTHSLSTRLITTNTEKATVFVFFVNSNYAPRYIGKNLITNYGETQSAIDNRTVEVETYNIYKKFYTFNGLIAYGFPFNLLHSNVNVTTLYKYLSTPGAMNGVETRNKQMNLEGSLTIGSNISENIDFVIDINGQYIHSLNILSTSNAVKYYSFSLGGCLNWQFTPSWKLVLEGGQTSYYGLKTSYYNAFICNPSIAYKFMKNKQAEICLSANDIFNQNNYFYYTTNELYLQTVQGSVLKRYFLLTFKYSLNKLNK